MLIRTFVNLSVERSGLVGGNFRKGTCGFLAECQLQITERVEGYQEYGERKLYSDLGQDNPHISPKIRDFRTTGVVLKIEAQWMGENGNKRQLADALRDLMVREYSISPQVIYDATYGSLRLTEPVFNELGTLISRLERSSELSSDEGGLVPKQIVSALRDWFEGLESADPSSFLGLVGGGVEPMTDGLLWVLALGNVVARRDVQGVLHDIDTVSPEIVSLGGTPKLCYRYKIDGPGSGLAPADTVELVGGEYEHRKWNPHTSEYVEDDENEF